MVLQKVWNVNIAGYLNEGIFLNVAGQISFPIKTVYIISAFFGYQS